MASSESTSSPPNAIFVYRPLSVAEPFGLSVPRHFSLSAIASDHGARLHAGKLEGVDHDRSCVSVRGGPPLSYDALFLAVGARAREWLPGALHFSGPEDVARLGSVIADLDHGAISSIAFVAPAALSWTLPLYELALLTAARVAERGRGEVQLSVLTPEPHALEVFGPAAARHVRELCANRGIELMTRTRAVAFQNGKLTLQGGESIDVDRVVALPELVGEPIAGVPHDNKGFIPVDEHGAVRRLPGVYAAGDGIAYPVKQGGLPLSRRMPPRKRSQPVSAPRSSRGHFAGDCAGSCSPGWAPHISRPRSRMQVRASRASPSTRCGGPRARSPDAIWHRTCPARSPSANRASSSSGRQ